MGRYRIAVIPGDGVGPEVVAAGLDTLARLAEAVPGLSIETETFPWGSNHFRAHGRMMPADGLERLREFARDVEILDRVLFLGHRSDVQRLLASIDVLWLASDFEGMPNVVLEAMAAGVPVVATNIPGTNELVVEGETGFLVPVGDRASFARQTRKLIEDKQLARRMGSAGQRRVAEHFSVEAMIREHAELYRHLTDRREGTRLDSNRSSLAATNATARLW